MLCTMYIIDITKEECNMIRKTFIPGNKDTDKLIVYSTGAGLSDPESSKKGNTQAFAEEIARQTGADLFELQSPDGHYEVNFLKLQGLAQKDYNENARPAYRDDVPDFSKYKTLFVGGPMWYMNWPAINYTFLESHDLTGIDLVPFATYVGHADGIQNRLAADHPEADHRTYLALKGKDTQKMNEKTQAEIKSWLESLGF